MIWGHSVTELFFLGGALMWPLLACSVLVVAIAIDRAWIFFRARLDFRRFVARVGRLVAEGRIDAAHALCRESLNPIAAAAGVYLEHREAPADLRTARIEREGSLALERLENRVRWLLILSHASTLLGLLGTVTGLVAAFQEIASSAGQVQPADLAEGIWEALLTTVFGLVIAVPGMLAHHFFDEKADRIARQMVVMVSYLDEWLGKTTRPSPLAKGEGGAVQDPLAQD